MLFLSDLFSFLLLLIAGYVVGHFKILRRVHVDGILRYLQFIAIPIMVLTKILGAKQLTFSFQPILIYYLPTITLFIISFFIAQHALKFSVRNSGLLAFGSTFSNLILVGLPVVTLFFNDAQMITFFLILSLHALSMQVAILLSQIIGKKIQLRRMLFRIWRMLKLSPIIAALIVAYTLRTFHIQLPDFMQNATLMVGEGVSGTALISIGVILSQFTPGHFIYVSSISCAIKLVVHPILVGITALLFGLSFDEIKIYVLMAALPSGLLTAIVSRTYSASSGFSSSIVALTTFFSTITLFITIGILF